MQHTNMTCFHRFPGWVHSFIPSLLKHNVPQYFIYVDKRNQQKKLQRHFYKCLAKKHPVSKTRKITTSTVDFSHNSTVGPDFPQWFFWLVDLDIRKYNERRCYHKKCHFNYKQEQRTSLGFTQILWNDRFIFLEELGS